MTDTLPPTLKLCKDCKWCVPEVEPSIFRRIIDYEHAKCGRPDLISRVDGSAYAGCHYERRYEDETQPSPTCGREGKFWEAKQ